MINQYLLLDEKNEDTIKAHKPQGISIKVLPVKDTPLWIIEYFIKGNNANNAKKLSDVHKFITKYSPKTLTCESSEYYNKKLFPLINDFERKLRKLLYLESSILNKEDVKKTIGILEDKKLGGILEMLFIDKEFIENTKIRVKERDKFNCYGKFSKSEILDIVNNIIESTLWDKLIGVDYKFTIKNHFRNALKYRNNVMHAHNIENENYLEAKDLFSTINKELKNKISKIIKQAEDSSIVVKKDVNTLFSSALASIELSCADSWKNALSTLEISNSIFKNSRINPIISSEDIESIMKNNASFQIPPGVLESIKNRIGSFQIPQNVLDTVATFGEIMRNYSLNSEYIKAFANLYSLTPKMTDLDDNEKIELESNGENEDIKKDKDEDNEK